VHCEGYGGRFETVNISFFPPKNHSVALSGSKLSPAYPHFASAGRSTLIFFFFFFWALCLHRFSDRYTKSARRRRKCLQPCRRCRIRPHPLLR
jgi:hypothetical protein